MEKANGMPPYSYLDPLNWPVAVCSVTVSVWFRDFWQWLPGPTTVYALVSVAFMLFQMADKLGFLERFAKRKVPDRQEHDI